LSKAVIGLAVATGVAVVASVALWQKLSHIQEALAQQSAQANQQSAEALALSKQASTLAQDASVKLALAQTRLNELSTQRSQVDELLQSLTKAKDDNLVMEIDTALRAAQQQAQLSGSVQPMLVALSAAQQRVKRANVPRLVPVSLSLERDLQRIQQAKVMDLPVVLSQLDQLLAATNQVSLLGDALPSDGLAKTSPPSGLPWADAVGKGLWGDLFKDMWRELLTLVQISRDQRELVRQQLRLHVLSARLSIVARQHEAAQRDLHQMRQLVQKHVHLKTAQANTMLTVLDAVQQALNGHTMPSLSDSLTVLANLQSGR
jgi:uroporphyrin-3 C-methyltransferase